MSAAAAFCDEYDEYDEQHTCAHNAFAECTRNSAPRRSCSAAGSRLATSTLQRNWGRRIEEETGAGTFDECEGLRRTLAMVLQLSRPHGTAKADGLFSDSSAVEVDSDMVLALLDALLVGGAQVQITAADVVAAREALLRLSSVAAQCSALVMSGAVGSSTSHLVGRINEELAAAGTAADEEVKLAMANLLTDAHGRSGALFRQEAPATRGAAYQPETAAGTTVADASPFSATMTMAGDVVDIDAYRACMKTATSRAQSLQPPRSHRDLQNDASISDLFISTHTSSHHHQQQQLLPPLPTQQQHVTAALKTAGASHEASNTTLRGPLSMRLHTNPYSPTSSVHAKAKVSLSTTASVDQLQLQLQGLRAGEEKAPHVPPHSATLLPCKAGKLSSILDTSTPATSTPLKTIVKTMKKWGRALSIVPPRKSTSTVSPPSTRARQPCLPPALRSFSPSGAAGGGTTSSDPEVPGQLHASAPMGQCQSLYSQTRTPPPPTLPPRHSDAQAQPAAEEEQADGTTPVGSGPPAMAAVVHRLLRLGAAGARPGKTTRCASARRASASTADDIRAGLHVSAVTVGRHSEDAYDATSGSGNRAVALQRLRTRFQGAAASSMADARMHRSISVHIVAGSPQQQQQQQQMTEAATDSAEPGPQQRAPVPSSTDFVLQLVRSPTDTLAKVLARMGDPQFDVFELSAETEGRPLSALAFALISRCGVLSAYPINPRTVARFLARIEDGYTQNPYHNSTHAADVLQRLHFIATHGGLLAACLGAGQGHAFSLDQDGKAPAAKAAVGAEAGAGGSSSEPSGTAPVVLLTLYIAAVVHDFEHKGTNNDFLVKNQDPLALLYNDVSPMENHHASRSMTLLLDKRYNFLLRAPQLYSIIRRNVVDMVLATDMKLHFQTLALFKTKLAPVLEARAAAAAALEAAVRAASHAAPDPLAGEPAEMSVVPLHLLHQHAARQQAAGGWGRRAQGCSSSQSHGCSEREVSGSTGGTLYPAGPLRASGGQRSSFGAAAVVGTGATPATSPTCSSGAVGRGNFLLPLRGPCTFVHEHKPHAAAPPETLPLPAGPGASGETSSHGPESRRHSMRQRSSRLRAVLTSLAAPAGWLEGPAAPRGVSGPMQRDVSGSVALPMLRPEDIPIPPLDQEMKAVALKVALKCADLGHLAAPTPIHKRWVSLLEEEFFRQGDSERKLGLPVSPLMDRFGTGITKSQTGFIAVVAHPLFSALVSAFPDVAPLLEALEANRCMWAAEEAAAAAAAPPAQ